VADRAFILALLTGVCKPGPIHSFTAETRRTRRSLLPLFSGYSEPRQRGCLAVAKRVLTSSGNCGELTQHQE